MFSHKDYHLQVCDGASHCGHGEDEASPGVCSGSSLSALLGLDLTTVLASTSLGLLLAGATAAAVCIWSLRQRRREAAEAAHTLLSNERLTSEYMYFNYPTLETKSIFSE